jgi:PAS domain S-box-containing protein
MTKNPTYEELEQRIRELEGRFLKLKRTQEEFREDDSVPQSLRDAPEIIRGVVEVVADDDVRDITDNAAIAGFTRPTSEALRNKLGAQLGEPPQILRKSAALYEQSRLTLQPVTFEYCDQQGDRKSRLSATVSYLGTIPGGHPRYAYVIRDVTGLEQAEVEKQCVINGIARKKDRLEALLNSITDEIWFADSEGSFTIVNPSGAQQFALGMEDATDVRNLAASLAVFRPDGSPRPVEESPALRALRGEVVRNQEEIVRIPATGELRHRQVGSTPVRDTNGGIIGSVSVVRDITEHKQIEEALRESEKRLKQAEVIAHLGSWELDLRHNRLTWSDEVYRIFGLQPQEFPATYEAFLESVHPDDRAAVDAAYSGSVREGGDTYEIEHRLVRKPAGDVRWVQEKCQHVRDPSGRIIRSLGMVLDITDRKQAEQALKKAHDELEKKVKERTYELEATVRALELEIEERKLAESKLRQWSRVFMDASDPIIIENLSGTILEMNREAERSYGWKREDLIGKSSKSIIPSERYQWAEQLRELCINGEEVRNWEGMRQDQFGRRFFVLVTAFPLTDEFGQPVAVATIAKDITFRKEMESELEKSHQRLQDLSLKIIEALESDRRNVARELHDSIGGSLAAIKFVLERIDGELAERPDQAAASLEKSISYLADTIKETKRISANLRPLTLDDLGLLPTIDWHTRQFSQQYGDIRLIKQIDIREEEIPNSSKIVIYRVLQEALNNCATHSKADTVHICLKRNGNQIEFEVKDNGCGFDVVEVFNRNDPLVGNGLKNMQDRTEICGGLFSLKAQPGEGTCIRLWFPLARR